MKIDLVEELNAHGPYDHGLWSEVKSGSATSEPTLGVGGGIFHERSRHLVDEICRIAKAHFSDEELSLMSLLDVGCYDGWVLVQIEARLNLSRMVGIEPRRKNIEKGVTARQAYGVATNVEFIQGEIESIDEVLRNEQFDIVLCLGTIHHVESTPRAIRKLAAHAKRLLVIDTMVIDEPKKDAREIKRLLNLRDVAYLGAPQDWAIAAFKYETPYFDGSTTGDLIVNVPQAKLVQMSIEACGLTVREVNRPDDVSYRAEFQRLRGVREAIIVGLRESEPSELNRGANVASWKVKARLHEEQFCWGQVPIGVLRRWSLALNVPIADVEGGQVPRGGSKTANRLLYRASIAPTRWWARHYLSQRNLPAAEYAILVNLSRSPFAKVCLELGKNRLAVGDLSASKCYLKLVTSSQQCDWRAFYRSCYFLSIVAALEGDEVAQEHYARLLRIANPEFPLTIQEGSVWALSRRS